MTVFEETKFLMDKYNVHPNKNLGQNFLIDEIALNLIADNANEDDIVVEVGPGLGTLTAMLAKRAKKVIAVELDRNMIEILEDRFKLYENVEIINDDILNVDLKQFGTKVKVIANLPYYITTQIVTKLIREDIKDITILIQKEVAERICAKPGNKDAGAITYFVNYYANAKIIGDVPKESFVPAPKVDSAVVNLKKLPEPRVKVENEKIFFDIIKENFTKRRKTINNSITNTVGKEKLKEILKELDISESTRGEKLSLEDFANIANLAK